MNFDLWLFQQINGLAGLCQALDWLGIFLASYLQYVVGAGLLVFWFWRKSQEERIKNLSMAGVALAAVVLSRLVIVEIIRWLWGRPRPFIDQAVNSLIVHESTGSFPSGHAAFFFALAMAVYLSNRRAGQWLFGAAILISLARVYVGVHYPLDILAGAVVGLLAGWLAWRAYQYYQNKKAR
ncbi:phosphatase PAP2 family protein [Patescibacteria group bacterium]|nr:phosphatase PAP2 family protein [Patescibacteria group bacterium]MBU2219603.1 phosphatase PAP2 family protein [Patescibacteria group bacterium]MBU2264941.1 phosphatase PAP2 family protein [Patescibacteria group bacterium]